MVGRFRDHIDKASLCQHVAQFCKAVLPPPRSKQQRHRKERGMRRAATIVIHQHFVEDDSPAGRQRLERAPREHELLQWVMQDKLNKTIADLMGISIKTVELHRKHLMDKLGAQSATHLMRMAVSGRVS